MPKAEYQDVISMDDLHGDVMRYVNAAATGREVLVMAGPMIVARLVPPERRELALVAKVIAFPDRSKPGEDRPILPVPGWEKKPDDVPSIPPYPNRDEPGPMWPVMAV